MKIQLKISDGIIIDKYIEEFSEYEIADGIYYLSSEKTEFVQSENIVEVCKRNKGIAIRTYENSLEVYNDPFCSVPVYIYKNENEIYITSQFDELLEKKLSVDRVGVYETFLFEAPLHDRTNFNEVKQLPAASFVNIDMKSLDLTISGYWDFSIKENTDITCKEDAIEAVWNVLCDEFSDYKGKELVMGISGGLDSRLSLCVLNEVAGLERIETFTFGHNKNILDYKLAKQVCEELEMKNGPRFFKLDGNSYLESMCLPIKSGGAVGIQHSHAYWCLKNMDTKNKILISNYYSDAIMGYDCIKPDYEDTIENCEYYKKVIENKWKISEDIQKTIISDIQKIANRRPEESNYSCYTEFMYLVERNPKFHVYLSHLYREHIDVVLPYAQYEVLETLISLPLKFRYRKKIEYLILSDKFKKMKDISSTRYSAFDNAEQSKWEKIYYDFGFMKMRAINLINCGLSMVSAGKVQLPNKYITENHLKIMNKYFNDIKKEAVSYLYESGIITEEQYNLLSKSCKRTSAAHEAFKVINVWAVLSEVGEKQ